jgi:RimJ/RimL family protein N-acetyltransferase
MDRLREHDLTLQSPRLRLRPLTEDDWDILLPWNNDLEVLHFSSTGPDGQEVFGYSLDEVQDIYRSTSERAFCFMMEHEGRPIGECWLQAMNLRRLLMRLPGRDLHRIDLMIGEKQFWGQGLGTEAIRLLTSFGFDHQQADRIYACGVADYNPRSRQAFRKVGYEVTGVVTEKPGGKMRFSTDLCLTRDKYLGRPQLPRLFSMAETAIFPDIWQPLEGVAEVVSAPADAQVLAACLPDFDAYFATLHTRLTGDIIRQCPRLKVVATPSTGLAHLDLEALAERGITVLSLRNDTELVDVASGAGLHVGGGEGREGMTAPSQQDIIAHMVAQLAPFLEEPQ